ncbi:MAG: hypothetical protein K6G80_06390 [Treponema sp.]|nr:hypothetical protein [Treponema sp.]
MAKTLAALDAEIAATKEALKDVHGSTTEVYARIVGYYRAVRNWNKGKRNEFNHRKLFVYNGEQTQSAASQTVTNDVQPAPQVLAMEAEAASENTSGMHYEFFLRGTCPNCPPVKAYMEEVALPGIQIDVDSEEGLLQAARKGVFAAPTVIFYGADNAEISRAHNVDELKAILQPQAVVA